MGLAAIPFGDTQASGLEQLGGAAPLCINAMRESTRAVRQRPGISTWSDFPSNIPNASPVIGMVPFGNFLVYVCEDRTIWVWTTSGTVVALSDSTAATKLAGSLRPSLLAARTKVVMAGGMEPQKWTGLGLSARLSGSPPEASHVASLATRLVLSTSDDSGRIRWSAPGDSGHETWNALNYAEAEARPDPLTAIADTTNELLAFGTETTQVYVPDPVLGFATGRALNVGLLVPSTLVRMDDSFAMLDRERRFLLTDGRSFEDLSTSLLGKTLQNLLRVTDGYGIRVKLDQWDGVAWFFPEDTRGFMWDRIAERFCEWRTFGDRGWTTPTITAHVAWPEKNLQLVGLSTGQIAKLDNEAYADLTATLKVELVTGFQRGETDAQKHCKVVRLRFERGITAQGSTPPKVALSWRNDTGAFCEPRHISLGVAGDYNPVVELRSLGVYRQRQWKLEYTANSKLTLVSATEETDTLAA